MKAVEGDGGGAGGWEQREPLWGWRVGGFAKGYEETSDEEAAYEVVVPYVVDAPVAACQERRTPMMGTGHKDQDTTSIISQKKRVEKENEIRNPHSNRHSRPSGEACAAVRGDPEGSRGPPAAGLHVGVLAAD